MTNISRLMAQRLLAEEFGLLNDEVGEAVERIFESECADAFEHEHLEYIVNRHAIKMARCPIATPRGLNYGNFVLGYTPGTGEEIRIPHQWMGSPSLSVGSTGSGKTNTAKFWISQLGQIDTCPGTLLIDCVKNEMESLAPLLGPGVSVLDTQDLKLNLFMPPDHVSPHSWAPNVADSLSRVLNVPAGARKIAHQAIHYLYETHGLFSGDTRNPPTAFDFREFVHNAKQFHRQSRDSWMTALDPLLMSLRGVLSYRKGWNIRSFAKLKTILELNTSSVMAKNYIVEHLFLSLLSSLVAEGASNVDPQILVYLDESSCLLESDDTAISSWIGLIRGVGMALLLSNQSAVSISQKVLSNIPNLFLGQCSSFADLNVMGSAMGLDAQQKRFLANHLRPGLFLGRLNQGSWRKPFLFTTPLFKSKPLGNRRRRYMSHKLASLPVVAACEFKDWQPEWAKQAVADANPKTLTPAQGTDAAGASKSVPDLEDDERRLFQAIVASPCKPVSFYPAELHMSKKTVVRLRKGLVVKKMIQEEHIQISGRGRPAILLAPTAHGLEMLGEAEA